jgi:hypothetical protein
MREILGNPGRDWPYTLRLQGAAPPALAIAADAAG